MDINHSEQYPMKVPNAWLFPFSQSDTGAGGPKLGAVSCSEAPQPLSNTDSNLRVSASPENDSAEITPLSADMETWGPTLQRFYPPVDFPQIPSEQPLGSNWTRVPLSYERENIPEWTYNMTAPGYNFRSYNNASPNESPKEPSMRATVGGYAHPSYLTQSYIDEQQQYFSPSIDDPISLRTYEMSEADDVSHRMHMESHSGAISSQSFGPFEQLNVQVFPSIIKPVSPREIHRLEITTPVVPSTGEGPRRSLRLNPSTTLPQDSRQEGVSAPVVPYYGTSLVSVPSTPKCRIPSSYDHHVGATSQGSDDYMQGPVSSESPSSMSQGAMEFTTPSVSANHLPSGGLHYNPIPSFRGSEQQYWGQLRYYNRWSHTEPSSPAEDAEKSMHRDKLRRSSLKTCELEENGLDFPGCFVLVPTAEGPTTSEAAVVEGPEPGLISTKKNFRRPMVESERQAIKLNRKFGVCLRCKMFKERCRGGFPCDRCKSLKLWKNICVTAHFADKSIFSRGIYKARVAVMLENVGDWFPQDFRNQEIVEVHNGYPPKLSITLQKFTPVDPSLLDHILWRELRKTDFRRIPSTPFGIIEEISSKKLESYFDEHISYLVTEAQQTVGPTISSQIYARTLFYAHKYTIDNQETGLLTRKALQIWAAQIVFFKGPFRITGSNSAGMQKINDPNSKVDGIIPLPRLANQQLDARVEAWMAELEQEVLAELQVKIFRRNPLDWFGIYLALFVTLSSIERDSWGLQSWAFDHDDLLKRVEKLTLKNPLETRKAWEWPLHETPALLVEKNSRLAATLAAHFRSLTKGYIPFTLDWYSDPVILMAGGEDVAIEYMRSVGQWVKESDQLIRARASAPYTKEVFDSLSLSHCSRLMVSEDTL